MFLQNPIAETYHEVVSPEFDTILGIVHFVQENIGHFKRLPLKKVNVIQRQLINIYF